MISKTFELSTIQLQKLLEEYPNLGKNSHVGNIAVKVVELYFSSLDPQAQFEVGRNGPDLLVHYDGKVEQFEIKGTTDKEIAWSKLKVSSLASYNALLEGMILIRVTNIGQALMTLYFMRYGDDFKLVPEARWSISPNKM